MAEIKKFVLTIGEQEIELTPGEAKELREALNELYGKAEREYVPVPQPYPAEPWWPRNPWSWPRRPYTWSTSGGTTSTFEPSRGVAYMAISGGGGR